MGTIQTFDAAVARVAGRQRALITHAQALGLGATPAMVHTRLATGRWTQVARGIYRVGGAPVTWHQRALAACMVAGPGAVVSHRSAAVIWDVSGFRPGSLELTVPDGRSARNALARVHRTIELPRADCTTHFRIPVTRPVRLVADLAGCVGPDLLEEAVDDVLCRRLCDLDGLRRGAEGMGGRRGSAALRAVLHAWDGEGVPANVAEMRIVRLLVDAGLPMPVRQFEIWVDGVLIARVDLAYPWARLAIELDNFRWHAGRAPFRSDRVRGNRIAAMGWRVLRATPEDATEGSELVRAVRGMLSGPA
ncbi:MAG TPA: type IV toxin-antitoxin system AbiEi family antitoxin domain-containing protein [Acidimicrobiales bacterium]|nr:type IV toxin-antitoxin system AbiEi family antitoxin domain-containing protein [Acidimicrobiales bacterium]